ILEKRTSAPAVAVGLNDQHALAGANLPHGVTSGRQVRLLAPASEVALEIGVGHMRRPAVLQRIVHLYDDVTSALAGVEDAGAIAETTGFSAKFVQLRIAKVEYQHRLDGIPHLLSVRPHVLDGSAAHVSGNAAQAFEAGAIVGDGMADKLVPVFT